MAIRQEDLIAMNEQIWASMLGLTLSSVEYADALAHGGRGLIGGCVQLVGVWQGAVRVDCSPALARTATTVFQGRKAEDLSVEEIRDTVGELANIVAGSVKALLPQPIHVSLPSVADGSDYDLSVRRGRVLLQCPFECEGERLIVSLIERDDAAKEAPGRFEHAVTLTSS
jgi:chemotaxis protein CheX